MMLRTTGLVQALQAYSVRTPQLNAQNSRLTLTKLVPNGIRVHKDDILVEFDNTTLLDEAREAEAKLSEIGHQLEEKRAQVKNDQAKRSSLLREAESELQKARLQLRRGPTLSEIDRLKNEAKAEGSERRVASMKKSNVWREKSEDAAIRVAELKHERQKLTCARIQANLNRLVIRSPQDGMVAIETVWKSGSMGPPQEGDQLFPGQAVLRVFDPSAMIVDATVNESDAAALHENLIAKLHLDAYPGAEFEARLESASPVATAGLESPVRTFSARFRILAEDPRLLPDLSAALEIPRSKVERASESAEANRAAPAGKRI